MRRRNLPGKASECRDHTCQSPSAETFNTIPSAAPIILLPIPNVDCVANGLTSLTTVPVLVLFN
jgi:hypothetical protein